MGSTQSPNHREAGPLRGELVRVRSREEILRTLDAAEIVQSLPFMPEMLQFAGREMRIHARADKTCNTVDLTGNHASAQQHRAPGRCALRRQRPRWLPRWMPALLARGVAGATGWRAPSSQR